MTFYVAGVTQHDVIWFHIRVEHAPAVHVGQPRRHLFEHARTSLGSDNGGIEGRAFCRSTYSDQQVRLRDAEQPVLLGFERVNLDEVVVMKFLCNLELVFGLGEELLRRRHRRLAQL